MTPALSERSRGWSLGQMLHPNHYYLPTYWCNGHVEALALTAFKAGPDPMI